MNEYNLHVPFLKPVTRVFNGPHFSSLNLLQVIQCKNKIVKITNLLVSTVVRI